MLDLQGFYENRIFPRMLNVADRAFRRERAHLLGEAAGDVLEIGIGTGNSLEYYSHQMTSLTGIEPHKGLLEQAQARLQALDVRLAERVTLVEGDAGQLPFADDSFDTVVAFLVFCTLPDPARAAAEVRRVLRPGGRLLFFEHVQAGTRSLARWQQRCNPLWRHLACGCNLNRDTRRTFEAAGFQIRMLSSYRHPKILLPLVAPVILGEAGLSPSASA